MLNLDSAMGVEVQENRLIFAAVRKGFQDFALRSHLVLDNFREIPRTELISRIQEFTRSNGFNRENVILGLPRDAVVVREVELPIEVEENLAQVVRGQVERFEPVEDHHSCYDYALTERDEQNRRVRIQITMARPEEIEWLLDLLGEVDLYPAYIRYSSTGLQHLLLLHDDGRPRKDAVLVLRTEHDALEVVVVGPGQELYSQKASLEGDVGEEEILNRTVTMLAPVEDRYQSFAKLYLVGSRAAELLPAFRERFDGCELLLERPNLKRKAMAQSALGELAVAVGLAVSGISRLGPRLNLIPEEKRLVGGRPSLTATYVLAALLILLIGAAATRGFIQQQALAAQVGSQIERLEPAVESAFRLREEVTAKQSRLEELQSLFAPRDKALLVLKDLSERIPDDTYLQNIQIQGDQLTMQGYSNQASSLLPLLLESPYLESVKTNWITQDPRQGKERFNFAAKVK